MRSTDFFEKVVTPYVNADGTQKVDKEGRPLKITKYVLKEQTSVEEEAPVEAQVELTPEFQTI